MDGGRGPIFFFIGDGINGVPYESAGQLKPINKIVNLSHISNKASLAASTLNGKIYGVPYALETYDWYYNKGIFNKYHLRVPTTWADFLHVCQVLKKNGVTPIETMGTGFSGSLASLWEWSAVSPSLLGPKYLENLVARKARLTDPVYVHALKDFTKLAQFYEPNWQAVGSAGTEMDSSFALGQVAMIADGGFDVQPGMLKDNPKLDLGEFMSPPLSSGQKPMQFWYPDGYIAMNSHISSPSVEKAAERILQFSATPQFGKLYTANSGEISPIAGVRVPAHYRLQAQAERWIQSDGIPVLYDINGGLGLPPAPKGKNVTAYQAMPTFELGNLELVIEGNLSPQKYAQKLQNAMAWYFK